MMFVYPASEQLQPTDWVDPSKRAKITYKIRLVKSIQVDEAPWELMPPGYMSAKIGDYMQRAKEEKKYTVIGIFMGEDIVYDVRLSTEGWPLVSSVTDQGMIFNSHIAVYMIYRAAFSSAPIVDPIDPMAVWIALSRAEHEVLHRRYAVETPHSSYQMGFTDSKPKWPNWKDLSLVKTDPIKYNDKTFRDQMCQEFLNVNYNHKWGPSWDQPFEKFILPLIKKHDNFFHDPYRDSDVVVKLGKHLKILMGRDEFGLIPTEAEVKAARKGFDETLALVDSRNNICHALRNLIGTIVGHFELTDNAEWTEADVTIINDAVTKYIGDRFEVDRLNDDLKVELDLADHEIAEAKKQAAIMADNLNESYGMNALRSHWIAVMHHKLEKMVPQKIRASTNEEFHDAAMVRLDTLQEQLAKAKWWKMAGIISVAGSALGAGAMVLHALVM